MKDKLELLGYVMTSKRRSRVYQIQASSKSILFGLYRITKSTLRKKLKEGKGEIVCCLCHYKWRHEKGGISELKYKYRIPPSAYKKIVKWSKSK